MTTHSFLTALSPIEYRPDDPYGRLASIRKTILSHEQGHSPFQHCSMAHMVRMQVIDKLTPPMGDTSGINLKTKYLLFVADIDGQIDDFLDSLYRVDASFVHDTWGRCLGYPKYQGAVFFRRYISRCQFDNPLGYAGFPTSVGDNLQALTHKNTLADWVAAHQGLSDADLQKAWHRDRRQIAKPDIPTPGNL